MQKYINRGFNIQLHPRYDEIDQHVQTTLSSKKYIKENYEYNIKYIETGEIDLSIYD